MAFCSKCGSKIIDGAKFCAHCGTSIGNKSDDDCVKREYGGKIVKCPKCGESLEAFLLNCPACGYELRGASASSAVKEFAKEIERIEQSRQDGFEHKLVNYIRTFPIPNTKEDLFEFIILSGSNIREDRYDDYLSEENKELSDAWQAKFEQAYNKAQISFKNEKDFKEIEFLYKQKNKQQNDARHISSVRNIKYFCAIMLLLGILFFIIYFMNQAEAKETEKENERLNTIVEEVYEALEEENYKLARAKVATLTFSKSDLNAKCKWDKTREELREIIDIVEYGMEYNYSQEDATLNEYEDYNEITSEETIDEDVFTRFTNGLVDKVSDLFVEEESEEEEAVKDESSVSIKEVSIEKDSEYSYMYDEWNLYIATAISDKIIKIEKWGKNFSSSKTVSYEYDVGTYKINDNKNNFCWLDNEHLAFTISMQDKKNSDFKEKKTITFTININDSNKYKGSNYDEKIISYVYTNDDWHQYRAMRLTESLIKIEAWSRGSSLGSFVYGYDMCLIDLNKTDIDFEWTNDEKTTFVITIQDEKNQYYWKEPCLVTFTAEKENYVYTDVEAYLNGDE